MTFDIMDNKKGNVLLNDALNTFYLQLNGVGHMVKNHSDSERKPAPPLHGLFLPASDCLHPSDRTVHTMAFLIPVVEHWLD